MESSEAPAQSMSTMASKNALDLARAARGIFSSWETVGRRGTRRKATVLKAGSTAHARGSTHHRSSPSRRTARVVRSTTPTCPQE